MFAEERHAAICQMVRRHRRMNFADLQKALAVSPATLRRDLTELEKAGGIIRVHGGVLDPAHLRSEVSFHERVLRHHAAKTAIAARASALIPPGASVFVDAGSTCLEAGKVLVRRKDVRLITHSVALIAEAMQGEAEVICPGGQLRRVSGALVGGSALGTLASMRADFALLGASGLDEEGCSTTELTEAELKKALLARARRKVLLADFSKWGQPSVVRYAGWEDFDDWIGDKALPATEMRRMKKAGVGFHPAGPP